MNGTESEHDDTSELFYKSRYYCSARVIPLPTERDPFLELG